MTLHSESPGSCPRCRARQPARGRRGAGNIRPGPPPAARAACRPERRIHPDRAHGGAGHPRPAGGAGRAAAVRPGGPVQGADRADADQDAARRAPGVPSGHRALPFQRRGARGPDAGAAGGGAVLARPVPRGRPSARPVAHAVPLRIPGRQPAGLRPVVARRGCGGGAGEGVDADVGYLPEKG